MNTNFQFANPWLLGLLLLVAVLAARHLLGRRAASPAAMTHSAAALTRDLPRSWRVALRPLLTAMRLLAIAMLVIALAGVLLIAALMLYPMMGKEFLPAFNEGSATISLAGAPGTSLAQSNEIGEVGVRLLQSIDEVKSVGRRAGRAEKDDHVMPVSVNEFDVEFNEGGRPREVVFEEIREKLEAIPGTFLNVGQPISHRLSHMLSGVSAKIAVIPSSSITWASSSSSFADVSALVVSDGMTAPTTSKP